jgi:hypothetical protein
MKKVITVLTMSLFAFTTSASAQTSTTDESRSESISVRVKKTEGTNTVRLPNGRGTIKFVARGDKFLDVVYVDAAGGTTRLTPGAAGTAGAPKQDCPYPIPDACFGTANKNIGLCMCRPTNLSAAEGGDPTAILIDVLLPPKKITAAAQR